MVAMPGWPGQMKGRNIPVGSPEYEARYGDHKDHFCGVCGITEPPRTEQGE